MNEQGLFCRPYDKSRIIPPTTNDIAGQQQDVTTSTPACRKKAKKTEK